MSNLMLASAVKAEIALNDLYADLLSRRDRGADALEYVGMVVLAALIVGAVFGVAKGLHLDQEFQKAADQILGKG